MFKKILVPIDGSKASRLGLWEGIKLAKDQGATLYLFHVLEEEIMFQERSARGLIANAYLKVVHDGGKKLIANAQAMAKKVHVPTKAFTDESLAGGTADLIVKQAKKLKADLIVIGTHGRRGIRRLVMGSDAEAVVRNSPIPVMLVRASAPQRRAIPTRRTVKTGPASAAGKRA